MLLFERPDGAEASVGRVEAFALDGLELWFNSSDHLPEHVHVKRRGQWEIRVYFLLCTERVGIRPQMGQEGSAVYDSDRNSQGRCGASGRSKNGSKKYAGQ